MRKITLLVILFLVLSFSCSKNGIDKTIPLTETYAAISAPNPGNPIIGKWQLGPCKTICGNSPDTSVTMNTNVDFVEFRTNDTAYYTYATTKAVESSPFKVLDRSTFILGDTVHIISFNGKTLLTYSISFSPTGFFSRQWMIYIKD